MSDKIYIGNLVGSTYRFDGNPFLDENGHEWPDACTGTRLEKIQTFTLAQCQSAMALELFLERYNVGWLQVAVIKALRKRLMQLEANRVMVINA